MTVSATAPYVSYAGAGTSGPFAIPFRFLANADLVVTKTSGEVTITLTGNTITGADDDDGGTLYTSAPVAAGETLKIYRATTRAQTAQYVANGPFPAATHERALDKAMLVDQEQDRDLGRAVKAPIGEAAPSLPALADREGFVMWDGAGNFTPSAGALPAGVAVSVAGAALLDDASAAAMRTTLGSDQRLYGKAAPYSMPGDTATNITTALQALVNDGVSQNRGVDLPAGGHLVYSPITVAGGLQMKGQRRYAVNGGSVLFDMTTTGDLLQIQTAEAVRISDLNFSTALVNTAGAYIRATSVGGENIGSVFKRLLMNAPWDGIVLDGFIRAELDNVHISHYRHNAITIDNSFNRDGGLVDIEKCQLFADVAGANAAIELRRGGGQNIRATAMVGGAYGFLLNLMDGPTGSHLMSGCWIEEQTEWGALLRQGVNGCTYSNVTIAASEFSRVDPLIVGNTKGAFCIEMGRDGGGADLVDWIQNVQLSGCHINYAQTPGAAGTGMVQIGAGRGVVISDITADAHGAANTKGIAVTNGIDVQFNGGVYRNVALYGAHLQGGTDISLNGVTLRGTSAAGSYGVVANAGTQRVNQCKQSGFANKYVFGGTASVHLTDTVNGLTYAEVAALTNIAVGSQVYVTNGQITAGVLASGGNGCMAFYANGAWRG